MSDDKSLENDFMRFIGVTSESQKRIQRFYLPFFSGISSVVDLACGDGDFVELLNEHGIPCRGVDRDPLMCREATARGRRVVCRDVFEFLKGEPPNSIGGIFSAHLVEHLPYEQVIDLIELGNRVLQPGGVIVLATPNVRGLFAHLESFYLHYGHICFYHPQLLAFFMKRSGFEKVATGENNLLQNPLWGNLSSKLKNIQDIKVSPIGHQIVPLPSKNLALPEFYPFEYYPPPSPPGLKGFILRQIQQVVRRILNPYFLELGNRIEQLNDALHLERSNWQLLEQNLEGMEEIVREVPDVLEALSKEQINIADLLAGALETVDRSVECYAIGKKP